MLTNMPVLVARLEPTLDISTLSPEAQPVNPVPLHEEPETDIKGVRGLRW